MIRPILVLTLLPTLAWAEPPVIGAPRLADPAAPVEVERPCENTQQGDNCSRFLACVGDDGLWIDGRADGWNEGTLEAVASDGTRCTGTWRYTWLGLRARSDIACEGGRTATVRFTAQDSYTGTGIGRGVTSEGEEIRVWSGKNVLEFLAGEDGVPRLPCDAGAIPIS